MKYKDFLKGKEIVCQFRGFDPGPLNNNLFDFQKDVVTWAIKKGNAALFLNTGLGKTICQLEWADQVCGHTHMPVLILAPLAVSKQTIGEGNKFGYTVNLCTSCDDVRPGINITNYEKLHKFDPDVFAGVVADESGIMKSFTGKIRNQMIEMWGNTPYKLSCTATPSPNDYEELGNQAEFLGISTRVEMLSMFFVNDTAHTGTWRLKGHAESKFWQWVCSWAIMIQKPSDIGYSDDGFILPPLKFHEHVITTQIKKSGTLFNFEASTLQERRQARKLSLEDRCQKAAEIINNHGGSWLIWCGLNAESDLMHRLINNSVEVKGADKSEHKEQSLIRFANGEIDCLVSKVKIAGYGMNFQNCHNIMFVGLSDSFEDLYQAVRRCYRFGQQKQVNVHVVTHESEGAVVANIKRKEIKFQEMYEGMIKNMVDITKIELRQGGQFRDLYEVEKRNGENWTLYRGDCVELMKKIPDDSIHYSIFSPPFQSLFVYSNSPRDIGNCKNDEEFYQHMQFLGEELHRVIMPGRLFSFHVMNLPSSINRDGFIGVKDLRGDLIRLFQAAGFIFHSEVVIWKDPLVQATRTKNLSLAHKQIIKDSSRCGQGFADYLITMRKAGDNPEPISRERGFERYVGEMPEPDQPKTNNPRTNKYSHHVWQRYASPVWFDIRQTNTLNERLAREKQDERHMCPLQLDVIERALELWSNAGDVILSPFAGIGSEGYVALHNERKFIGIELKKSYFDVACNNLDSATVKKQQMELF